MVCGTVLLKPIGVGITAIKKIKTESIRQILTYGILILILGYFLSFVLLTGFLLIFPVCIGILIIAYYGALNVQLELIKFILVFLLAYVLFRGFEILFSIHLVERIKNDKIAWLDFIKYDMISHLNTDEKFVTDIKEKLKVADIYTTIPYTSLAAFTRYEIIPVYRYDVTLENLQKRLEFLNNH